MSVKNNVDSSVSSLVVDKLDFTLSTIEPYHHALNMLKAENAALQAQLFRYAEDFQKLLRDRDSIDQNKNEKNAAYQQLEKFNQDFMVLLEQKEKSYSALESSHLDTIRRLATAAEFKDDDTGVHILRMSRFSAMIAAAVGQSDEYCNLLEQASPMHDIGKIGVPDNILKKEGQLTPEEWIVMRKHPEYGANILGGSDVPVLKMAEEVALSHHEKYDGSGYPLQLKGENIPLSGRIVALADFFDALTMDRCYRPAFSDQKALAMVKEGRGTHFDPNVVDAFLTVSHEIINERERINRINQAN